MSDVKTDERGRILHDAPELREEVRLLREDVAAALREVVEEVVALREAIENLRCDLAVQVINTRRDRE